MPRARDRLPFLAAAAICLLTALWAGLARSGWDLPMPRAHHPLAHGPLFVCAFLGTLISLEKAVALERSWAYLAPAFAALGGLGLIVAPRPRLAALIFAAASAILVLVLGHLLQRHLDLAGVVMLSGAVAWLVGNLHWAMGGSIPTVVPWWLAFPTLTILGERLELSRVAAPPRSAFVGFLVALTIYASGLVLFLRDFDLGLRLQGFGLLVLAVWLLRYDLARRTVRRPGAHRFTALCLLSGFLWLGVGGANALIWGANLQGLRYDALLHALLLGFVFGMIFGHAPIIAPMLFGRRLAWSRVFYGPLVLLQISLLLRLAGDWMGWEAGRAWGAAANVAALILFLPVNVRAGVLGERISGASRPQ
jgi:hypothetical protein